MSRDNKRMFIFFGCILVSLILAYKLPHDSYSISQYIIPPIRISDGSSLYLSALLPLLLIIIGISGILSLERFSKSNKALLLLFILVIIIPVMNWVLDFSRTNYCCIRKDGLFAVDIKNSEFSFSGRDNELIFHVEMKLVDYSRSSHNFKIKLYLPKYLNSIIDDNYIESDHSYTTYGYRKELSVDETIKIKLKDVSVLQKITDRQWNNDNMKYVLYNEKETIEIIDHGW